jgi:hypothetical protein
MSIDIFLADGMSNVLQEADRPPVSGSISAYCHIGSASEEIQPASDPVTPPRQTYREVDVTETPQSAVARQLRTMSIRSRDPEGYVRQQSELRQARRLRERQQLSRDIGTQRVYVRPIALEKSHDYFIGGTEFDTFSSAPRQPCANCGALIWANERSRTMICCRAGKGASETFSHCFSCMCSTCF